MRGQCATLAPGSCSALAQAAHGPSRVRGLGMAPGRVAKFGLPAWHCLRRAARLLQAAAYEACTDASPQQGWKSQPSLARLA